MSILSDEDHLIMRRVMGVMTQGRYHSADRRDAAQLTAYAGVKARYLTDKQGWSDPAVRAAWRRNIASAGMTPDQFVDFLTKP